MVSVPAVLTRWLWNFIGIVCAETSAAAAAAAIIKRRLKNERQTHRYINVSEVCCISKGLAVKVSQLQVPAESLDLAFF